VIPDSEDKITSGNRVKKPRKKNIKNHPGDGDYPKTGKKKH
jgi:hypothetical protein